MYHALRFMYATSKAYKRQVSCFAPFCSSTSQTTWATCMAVCSSACCSSLHAATRCVRECLRLLLLMVRFFVSLSRRTLYSRDCACNERTAPHDRCAARQVRVDDAARPAACRDPCAGTVCSAVRHAIVTTSLSLCATPCLLAYKRIATRRKRRSQSCQWTLRTSCGQRSSSLKTRSRKVRSLCVRWHLLLIVAINQSCSHERFVALTSCRHGGSRASRDDESASGERAAASLRECTCVRRSYLFRIESSQALLCACVFSSKRSCRAATRTSRRSTSACSKRSKTKPMRWPRHVSLCPHIM